MGRLPLSDPAMGRAIRYLISCWKTLVIPALLLGAPESVTAESSETQRELVPPEVQALWPAVGRLILAGRGFCTGTLISDRLVLAAAHCMFNPRIGRAIRPMTGRVRAPAIAVAVDETVPALRNDLH